LGLCPTKLQPKISMEIGKHTNFMSAKIFFKSPSRLVSSVLILLSSLGLAYAPIPGLQKTVIVVSGTEIREPLEKIVPLFEQENPNIKIELKFQGSQELANRFLDEKNDFQPTVLIPANGEILQDLATRLKTRDGSEPFYGQPQAIANTILVGVAWLDRGQTLFGNGGFQWNRLEQAIQGKTWGAIGGNPSWGSFDLVITDPARSNSGQLALALWVNSKQGRLDSASLNSPPTQSLFSLVKKSVYQPPQSTDILLQEFIGRGSNDADVALVYESTALYRWQQSAANQGKPYQIYYLNPTVSTTSTAAIVRRRVDEGTAQAAREFINYLTQPPAQNILIQFGFRPANSNIDLKSVPNSPWSQNIPGANTAPPAQTIPMPNSTTLQEIQRLWERAN